MQIIISRKPAAAATKRFIILAVFSLGICLVCFLALSRYADRADGLAGANKPAPVPSAPATTVQAEADIDVPEHGREYKSPAIRAVFRKPVRPAQDSGVNKRPEKKREKPELPAKQAPEGVLY